MTRYQNSFKGDGDAQVTAANTATAPGGDAVFPSGSSPALFRRMELTVGPHRGGVKCGVCRVTVIKPFASGGTPSFAVSAERLPDGRYQIFTLNPRTLVHECPPGGATPLDLAVIDALASRRR